MAASPKLCFVLFFFACSPFVHKTTATDVVCENLPPTQCAFAVSSSGKRCQKESSVVCKASEMAATKFSGHIETDQCVNACGADRLAIGMSSALLGSPDFTARLCSPACFNSCPNIIDLYSNLAAGEGKSLASMCAGAGGAQAPSAGGEENRRSTLDMGAFAPTPSSQLFP